MPAPAPTPLSNVARSKTASSEQAGNWDVFAVSRALRERGWQVPAYTLPKNREDLSVLRIVCRNGFGHDLADMLLADLRSAVSALNTHPTIETASGPAAFRH